MLVRFDQSDTMVAASTENSLAGESHKSGPCGIDCIVIAVVKADGSVGQARPISIEIVCRISVKVYRDVG